MNIFGASETMGLVWGGVGFITFSYALSRVLRGSKHGYSIRLQLFFTLFVTSMMSTTLIGVWAINRIEARAALLFEESGLSTEMFEQFFKDFGAKTGLILGLLVMISAGGAWALGRGLASPIERLAAAAENVSIGGDISSLPRPPGREVRRLRESLVVMHEALEDRRQFEIFIADLSHDLKNPVAAIKASVEVLQAGAAEEREARDRFILRIDEASERLNLLLSDFLSLARLESRGIRLDPKPFSPLLSLTSAIKSLESLAQLKEINLEIHFIQEHISNDSSTHTQEESLDHRSTVKGSHRWLTRAFENLISNAIKFSPVGSTVWLDYYILPLESQWCLVISDEGKGVPQEMVDELFIRFVSRHDSPYSTQGDERAQPSVLPEGTGLGLAIVKQVIEAHRGEVLLISPLAELERSHREVTGAQFVVSLPLSD